MIQHVLYGDGIAYSRRFRRVGQGAAYDISCIDTSALYILAHVL